MGKRFGNAFVSGFVLWGLLTACSAAVDRSAPGGGGWDGDVVPGDEPPVSGRPLAVDWDEAANTNALYRLDPRSLRLHRVLRLHTRVFQPWDVSPDDSLLLASSRAGVRVIDLGHMRTRTEFEVDVPGLGGFRDAYWVDDDVAILVASGGRETKLIRVQPSTGEVLGVERLTGTHVRSADAGNAVVVLAQDVVDPEEMPDAPEPATFAVMDASGAFGVRRLDAIGAGHFQAPGADYSSMAAPALAVQAARATIVGTDGAVVTVDLTDLEVKLEGKASFSDVLAAWFAPAAQAKILDATDLHAEWISEDELLVSGYRTTSTRVSRHDSEQETDPAGAAVLDADDWSATVVDEDAYEARMAGDRLLTWTRFLYGDERHEGIGLRAYDRDGELAWEAFDRQFVDVLGVHRGVVFVEHGWHRVLMSSVDADTGEVLKTREMWASLVEP